MITVHTLATLTPLSRPAASRALSRACAEEDSTDLRLNQLASLQHAFRRGADPYPSQLANPETWSLRDFRNPSPSLTATLLREAAREKLLVAIDTEYIEPMFPRTACHPARLHPQHQIDLLLKLKLVRDWEKNGAHVMQRRGPLIAELLRDNAAHAVSVDAAEAFYTVFRSAAPDSYRGPAVRKLAAGLGIAARNEVLDAAPLLRMMASLSPFSGTADDLLHTAQAVLV